MQSVLHSGPAAGRRMKRRHVAAGGLAPACGRGGAGAGAGARLSQVRRGPGPRDAAAAARLARLPGRLSCVGMAIGEHFQSALLAPRGRSERGKGKH